MNQIHKRLLKKLKTIAVAESCTGGLLSETLTRNSGSSVYFIFGVVTYSNKSKENILKIPPALIAQKGAVSSEVAGKMARSIRILAKTDFGVGITGIAGPTGATPGKPIGTVFIAISKKNKLICKRSQFRGSRLKIRQSAVLETLKLLRKFL